MSSAPTRPVLRYHGGKWRLAPWIISHFPAHRVYTEAFGGAASVLLQKPRAYSEVYNELDGEITNLFRVLRDQREDLERRIRLTPFSRAEFEAAYLPHEDPVEQARRTVARSFMGFGSVAASGRKTGFRSNVTRPRTTPAHDWAAFPEALALLQARLRGVIIENEPAARVLVRYDAPNTLHYVDPPYPLSTRTGTAKWDRNYRHDLKDDDHREIAVVLRSLSGAVVLSGYPCELYDLELYPDWRRITRRAMADGAKERTEVLWLNEAAADRLNPTLWGKVSGAE